MNIETGSYVEYKNDVYLAFSHGEMLHIINPCSGTKLHVAARSVQPTRFRPALVVKAANGEYVVTRKGNIFSVKTCRKMAWGSENGVRRAIITAANALNKTLR